MEISQEKYDVFLKNYWYYFVSLDRQMLATERYIEFSELNFSTFSVELLKLYQAVCSEIDVVGKMLAKEVNPGFNPDDNKNSILKWWFEIQEWYSESGRKKAVFRQNTFWSHGKTLKSSIYQMQKEITTIVSFRKRITKYQHGGQTTIVLNTKEHLLTKTQKVKTM